MEEKENLAILVWSLWGGGAERIAGLLSIYLSAYYHVYLFLADTEYIIYDYEGEIVDVEPDGKTEYREENVAKAKEKYNIRYSISFLDDMNYINIRTKKDDYVIVSARCSLSYFDPPQDSYMYAMKRYFNDADAVVAVSEGVKYEMVQKFGVDAAKIVTIYNFIQQDIVQQAAQESTDVQEDGRKRIVSIGRFDRQKNQIRLLRQFAGLRTLRDDVKLILIGGGEEEASIREEINRLGIDGDVELIPYCKNPFPYLAKAYMYAMTSHYEGLPNAILEAMCLRIPVVAVDCVGGPRELLSGRSDYENPIRGVLTCPRGILVEDRESDDDGSTFFFRDAMNYMLEHPDYHSKVQADEHEYMQSYQNAHILEKWKHVLEDLKRTPQTPAAPLIDSDKTAVIYGAGKLGREALKLCRQNQVEVLSFLVSNLSGNPSEIEGVPVCEIDNSRVTPENVQVLLGLSKKFHDEAVRKLRNHGYSDIRFVQFKKENEEIV